MPNLDIIFEVYGKGFDGINMRRSKMIGHRDSDGRHCEKFAKKHLKEACMAICEWMNEYNKSIDNPKPSCRSKIDSWTVAHRLCTALNPDEYPAVLQKGSDGCKCHD